jgi:hypothetical protein
MKLGTIFASNITLSMGHLNGHGKSVWLSIIACLVCGGWWKAEGHCAPTQKSVIDMIWLLLSVSDRPIIMIGPGGLLLVVPHLFAVPVSVYGRGCKKANNLNLDVKNIIAGLHIEHCWRSSNNKWTCTPHPICGPRW